MGKSLEQGTGWFIATFIYHIKCRLLSSSLAKCRSLVGPLIGHALILDICPVWMSRSELKSCGFLRVFPAVWQQQSSVETGALGNNELQSRLSQGQRSDFGSPERTWLLYPLCGDIWVGKHKCFPLLSAEGGSHVRSTAIGALFMHHPVAGKILYSAGVAFYFSFF